MAPSKKPTMKDVARLSGFSAMTVSRVLTGQKYVAVQTRERINDAVVKLGYVPDRMAGSLSSRRSGFIAVVLPALNNANFADTAIGLTETLRQSGFELLIGYTNYSLNEEEKVVHSLLARRPEALVIVGDEHTRAMRHTVMNADIPVVEIWSNTSQPIDHAVGFSNNGVGRAAARYLVSLGHSKIGAVGPLGSSGVRDRRGEARLAGFASYLEEVGMPTNLVIRHGDVPFSFTSGADAMARLLDIEPHLEAAFLISDVGCFGALMECQRRGIVVPDDMSLVGFGDFEIGVQSVPPLTTVAIDAIGIGRETALLLLNLLDEFNYR